jgi:hypothetical protein
VQDWDITEVLPDKLLAEMYCFQSAFVRYVTAITDVLIFQDDRVARRGRYMLCDAPSIPWVNIGRMPCMWQPLPMQGIFSRLTGCWYDP